jgi:hypothetical protein
LYVVEALFLHEERSLVGRGVVGVAVGHVELEAQLSLARAEDKVQVPLIFIITQLYNKETCTVVEDECHTFSKSKSLNPKSITINDYLFTKGDL